MAGRGLAAVAVLAALAGCAGVPRPAAEAPAAAVAAAPFPQPPPAPPAWPEAADCRRLAAAVLAMPEAERGRLRAEGAPLALAVADGPGLLPPEEAAAAVEIDLPVAAVDRTDGARCFVLAGRPRVVPGGGRRLVAHEVVRSEYYAGTARRSSTADARARERDEEDEPDGRVLRTGDPVVDLVGLVAGGIINGVGRLARARRPPGPPAGGTADGALPTRPYVYQLSTFEVGRSGALGVALVDRGSGRAHEARQTVSERKLFAVAEGRHRSDREALDGTGRLVSLPGDVAVFEAAPPRPRLSDLLRAVLDGGGGEGRAATVEDLVAGIGSPTPAAPMLAGGGRKVAVETLAGPAEGMWLDEERIAVPSAALGRSSLVQVTGPDGTRAFGMIERVDHAEGRAVVRVGRPGITGALPAEGLEAVLRDLKTPGGR